MSRSQMSQFTASQLAKTSWALGKLGRCPGRADQHHDGSGSWKCVLHVGWQDASARSKLGHFTSPKSDQILPSAHESWHVRTRAPTDLWTPRRTVKAQTAVRVHRWNMVKHGETWWNMVKHGETPGANFLSKIATNPKKNLQAMAMLNQPHPATAKTFSFTLASDWLQHVAMSSCSRELMESSGRALAIASWLCIRKG